MFRTDILNQVVEALMGADGSYDAEAITDELIVTAGYVDVDSVHPETFWAIVLRHPTEA